MLRKLVTYNSQNYAGTLGSCLEAGSINLSINRSNIVRSCSAMGCANRDTKENRIKDIRFFRILVNYENWRLWLVAIGRKDFDPVPNAAVCSVHFIGGKCMQKHYQHHCR